MTSARRLVLILSLAVWATAAFAQTPPDASLAPDVQAAFDRFVAGNPAEHDEWLLVFKNKEINRARVYKKIDVNAFQKVQADYNAKIQAKVHEAAAGAGTEARLQTSKATTLQPGSDTDVILSKVTAPEQIDDALARLNKSLLAEAQAHGIPTPSEPPTKLLDIDLMADPARLSATQFRTVAPKNNDAYARKLAAEYEAISRSGTPHDFTPEHVTEYQQEMGDFIRKKVEHLKEIAAHPENFQYPEYERVITESRLNKYVQRVEALEDAVRAKFGLPAVDRVSAAANDVVIFDKSGQPSKVAKLDRSGVTAELPDLRTPGSLPARGMRRGPTTVDDITAAAATAENSLDRALSGLADAYAGAALKDPAYAKDLAQQLAKITRGLSAQQQSDLLMRLSDRLGPERTREIARAMEGQRPPVPETGPGILTNPAVTIFLDAAMFYQCADEAKRASGQPLLSTAELTKCFAVSAGLHLATLVLEPALMAAASSGTIAAALAIPGVGVVAIAGLAYIAGRWVLPAIWQMLVDMFTNIGTLTDYQSYKDLYEQWSDERALAAAQGRNVEDFERQLARETQVVTSTLDQLRQVRDEVLKQVDALEKEQRDTATSLKTGRARLLQLVQQLKQRMVPACDRLDQSGVSGTDVSAADQDAAEIEGRLKGAQATVALCSVQKDLADAASGAQRANALMADLDRRLASASAAQSASTAGNAAMQSELPTFAQAKNLWDRLNASLPEAERLRERMEPTTQAVHDANDVIASRLAELNGRLDFFSYAFPPEFLAVSANASRLAKLREAIKTFARVADERLEKLDTANFDVSVNLVNIIKEGQGVNGLNGRLEIEGLFKRLAACTDSGKDNAAALEQIDTARTIAQVAISNLGANYQRTARACQQKLAGGKDTPAGPDTSSADADAIRQTAERLQRVQRDREAQRFAEAERLSKAEEAATLAREKAERAAAEQNEIERQKQEDLIRRLGQQAVDAANRSRAAQPPPAAPPAPATPPAATPPPIGSALTTTPPKGGTPAAGRGNATPNPFAGPTWMCNVTYTETEDGKSKQSGYRENWEFFGSLEAKYDLWRWLYQGDVAHIFGTATRGTKVHIEFADHDMDPALQFKSNPTREPWSLYSRMEIFDLERVNDKLLGTYSQIAHDRYRNGGKVTPDYPSRTGVIACDIDTTTKLIVAIRTK